MELYICKHCGNIVTKLTDAGVPVVCCGSPMQRLEAGVTEAALEKHLPVARTEGGMVQVDVGSQPHPMAEEHFIEWVLLQTNRGFAVHRLAPGQAPHTVFALAEGETAQAVYAYCNLHGLWKTDLA